MSTPAEPFYCKEHEAVWSPSLKRYVCDFCGHYMPDPDMPPEPLPPADVDRAWAERAASKGFRTYQSDALGAVTIPEDDA